jgi:hypothetical protein
VQFRSKCSADVCELKNTDWSCLSDVGAGVSEPVEFAFLWASDGNFTYLCISRWDLTSPFGFGVKRHVPFGFGVKGDVPFGFGVKRNVPFGFGVKRRAPFWFRS